MNTLIINSPRSVNETTVDLNSVNQAESLQQLSTSYFIGKCVKIEGKRADWSNLYQENSQLDTTMPQEILTHTLTYVNAQSLGTLSQVSKFWNIQAHSARNHKILDFSCKDDEDLELSLKTTLRIVGSLKGLEHDIEMIDFCNLHVKYYDTRDMRLKCGVLWNRILMAMDRNFIGLKNLKSLNCEKFQIFSITGANHMGFLGCYSLKAAANSLVSLNLNYSTVYAEDFENFTELEDLSISNCLNLSLETNNFEQGDEFGSPISEADEILKLLKLSKLKKLDISENEDLTIVSLRILSKLDALETLILRGCSKIDYRSIEVLNTFKGLKYVDLRGTCITEEGLKLLSSNIRIKIECSCYED